MGAAPSLYLPGTHAVHATGHETHGLRAAVRHVVVLVVLMETVVVIFMGTAVVVLSEVALTPGMHDIHSVAPASDPVPLGHAGHALRPEQRAYLPGEQAAPAVAPVPEAHWPGPAVSHLARVVAGNTLPGRPLLTECRRCVSEL